MRRSRMRATGEYKTTLLVVLAAIFALTTIIVLTISLSDLKNRNNLRRVIDRIETLISSGNRTDLPAELKRAGEYARNPAEWTRLLRYAWSEVPDRETLYQVAQSAHIRHPDTELFRYLVRYSALVTNRPERARELYTDDETSELAQDLTVLANIDRIPELRIRPDADHTRELIGALHYDPEASFSLYSYIPDPRLLENAALLSAASGTESSKRTVIESAGLLRRIPISPDASILPRLVTAAWLADEDWLYAILATLPGREATTVTVLLMQADAFIRQQQLDLARSVYDEVLNIAPEFSEVPYLNSSYIFFRTDRNGDAADRMRLGLHYFPDSPQIKAGYAADLIRNGNIAESMKFLQETALAENTYAEDDKEAIYHLWLLAHTTRSPRSSPERFESDLWRYLNLHPDAHEVAAFLCSYLRVRKDSEALSVLTGRYAGSSAAWFVSTDAVLLAESGNLVQADARFRELIPQTTYWEDIYNAALFTALHYPESTVSERIDELYRRAESLPLDDTARAYFVLLRAEAARMAGNHDRALLLAQRAIELGPDEESFYSYFGLVADR